MFYHVLVQIIDRKEPIFELDLMDLDQLKQTFIVPYFKKERFMVDGFFVDPAQVMRLVITETERNSKYYYEMHMARNRGTGIIDLVSRRWHFVTRTSDYCKDITRQVMKEVECHLDSIHTPEISDDKKDMVATTSLNTIFLSYSYQPADEEMVQGLKGILEISGFRVLEGKADRLGSISQAILHKIRESEIVVIVMTKRDEKKNGQFTTSSWLLEEKGAAKALDKKVAMFVEEGIDQSELGGIHGDDQMFYFTRNNFPSKISELIRILKNS